MPLPSVSVDGLALIAAGPDAVAAGGVCCREVLLRSLARGELGTPPVGVLAGLREAWVAAGAPAGAWEAAAVAARLRGSLPPRRLAPCVCSDRRVVQSALVVHEQVALCGRR